jgi:hypothetical protein
VHRGELVVLGPEELRIGEAELLGDLVGDAEVPLVDGDGVEPIPEKSMLTQRIPRASRRLAARRRRLDLPIWRGASTEQNSPSSRVSTTSVSARRSM